jgi:hypothetical protein
MSSTGPGRSISSGLLLVPIEQWVALPGLKSGLRDCVRGSERGSRAGAGEAPSSDWTERRLLQGTMRFVASFVGPNTYGDSCLGPRASRILREVKPAPQKRRYVSTLALRSARRSSGSRPRWRPRRGRGDPPAAHHEGRQSACLRATTELVVRGDADPLAAPANLIPLSRRPPRDHRAPPPRLRRPRGAL